MQLKFNPLRYRRKKMCDDPMEDYEDDMELYEQEQLKKDEEEKEDE